MNDETSAPEGTKEIAADIEQTRHDLAETIDALAAKADVPSRVREKAIEVRSRAGGSVDKEKALPAALYAVGGVCAAAGLLMWRAGRKK